MLESVRAEDPEEPFWLGVRRLDLVADHVEIEFNDRRKLRLLRHGDVQVECHLYDPEVAAT
jgi:hypothetical protein